jgi:putative AlgH/UPF0301 family transcriptional regulator
MEKKKYTPTKSLREEIRKNWRSSRHSLLFGFECYKYLRSTFNKMEQSLPWYNQLTLQSIEQSETRKPVLVNEIKTGNILISHPSVIGYYNKSVILIVKQTGDTTLGLVIPGIKSNINDSVTYWQGGTTAQDFNLLHTQSYTQASPVLDYLWLTPIQSHDQIKLFPPSAGRVYCSISKWSTAQLTAEIEAGHWFLAQCPIELLFPMKAIPAEYNPQGSDISIIDLTDDGTTNSDIWKKLMRSMGGEYYIFSFIDGDLPQIKDQSNTA